MVNNTFYALNNENERKYLVRGQREQMQIIWILHSLHSISVCLWTLCLQNFTGFEVCLDISLQMLSLYVAGM